MNTDLLLNMAKYFDGHIMLKIIGEYENQNVFG